MAHVARCDMDNRKVVSHISVQTVQLCSGGRLNKVYVPSLTCTVTAEDTVAKFVANIRDLRSQCVLPTHDHEERYHQPFC